MRVDAVHVRSVGGILYYTILYPTSIPTPTFNSLTRMFDVYLKVYNGIEREKIEKRVRVSKYVRLDYHIRLLLLVLLLYVIHYKI